MYLVQGSVPDSLLLPILPDFASFLPEVVRESVASWLGTNRHPAVHNSTPSFVLLQMTSEGVFLELRNMGYTLLTSKSHYLKRTQPGVATEPNHPADDLGTLVGTAPY